MWGTLESQNMAWSEAWHPADRGFTKTAYYDYSQPAFAQAMSWKPVLPRLHLQERHPELSPAPGAAWGWPEQQLRLRLIIESNPS